MDAVIAYGVSVPPGDRHLDLTPLVSIVAALLVARSVVGLRLTPMVGIAAAFVASLWATLAEPLGLVTPSAAVVLLVVVLRVAVVRRAPGRDPG